MYLAVCTIQRDNAKRVREWIVYHSLVGVSKFYFLSHMPDHETRMEISKLVNEGYDIEYFEHNHIDEKGWYPIQIKFYDHVYKTYQHLHKWIAFIDADEFLVPVQETNLSETLARYENEKLSALGVYWMCYGSSGHMFEPEGLIIENYKYRMEANHLLASDQDNLRLAFPNKHIKSIVKCGDPDIACYPGNMHMFKSSLGPLGTCDELLRPFYQNPPYFFYDYNRYPSHKFIRINHYVVQSFEHYILKKSEYRRNIFGESFLLMHPSKNHTKTFWEDYDVNDVYDDIMDKYIPAVKEKMT